MAQYHGSGTILIKINDHIIEQNNACFKAFFVQGRAESVSVTEKQPDVEMNISDFSRCIIGAFLSEEAKELESVKINTDTEVFDNMFYKKPNFIADYF